MDLSSTEPGRARRLLCAAVLLGLILLGVGTMGVRMDEVTLGLTECLKNEEDCIGERLDLAYLRIAEVTGSSLVLRGQGFTMEVTQWAGPDLPERLSLARVSVSGTYLGQQRMSFERGMVHRFRKLKELVGVAVLIGWVCALITFVRRRTRG